MLPKALGKFKPRTSESRRIPLEREISFRVPRFENFVTEYSANISATGIFVRTDDPLEPGTDLSLEFKVADDWNLIRGRGRVVWVRSDEEGPEAPAGMGIRFLEIDPQSRRLIHWMVDKHAREGGETFEFEELRESADQALGETFGVDEVPPFAGRGGAHSASAARAAFSRRLLLVAIAVGLLGLLSWLFLRLTPPDTGSGVSADSQAAAIAAEPTADEPPPPAAAARPISSTEAARALINGWADSWSEGRVEEYLACYSTSFVPSNGLTFQQWSASRAERLSAPQYIRVSITALELEVVSPDRIHATFFQNYRSDRFEDTVRKRLELGREEGHWRILRERVIT